MTLRVEPCGFDAARHAVTMWHYSRSMPMPPRVLYGAWEDTRFIGAVVFCRGANRHMLAPFGLLPTQGAELARVALRDHAAPVSQIVAAAVRRLRVSNPGLRLLVSYADPARGHHGGIYQAMGWTYLGTTAPEQAFRDADGRIFHHRIPSTTGWVTQFGKRVKVPKRADLEPINLPGKHRYALPLDRAARRRVGALAQPYPRGRGVDGDTPAHPAGDAGSTPADRSNPLSVTLRAAKGGPVPGPPVFAPAT
jgi:hypothetical protein